MSLCHQNHNPKHFCQETDLLLNWYRKQSIMTRLLSNTIHTNLCYQLLHKHNVVNRIWKVFALWNFFCTTTSLLHKYISCLSNEDIQLTQQEFSKKQKILFANTHFQLLRHHYSKCGQVKFNRISKISEQEKRLIFK